ncbi:MAG: hypothetical protein K8T89_00360 [Planctomycetes bacterium]|nr:hypothetical protein [Planctomycetota bacterium]
MEIDEPLYTGLVGSLVSGERLAVLGPGLPNRSVEWMLAELTPEESCFPGLRDRDMALACIAGLWLYHDFLDESHKISQDLSTPTGSYWHALMHRREPDAPNSKYWFRQVGHHPVFDLLTKERGQPWDPYAFVDRCEAARDSKTEEEKKCRRLQLREWQILFEWCWTNACGPKNTRKTEDV